ncbi:MAG TPA: SDR family NAD(P)-dependent oxidoreductase [Bacteroidales bacterium]|nr:SDR family NAD(P)-dependent oxidoreductase [Bacteroidales bacterium]HRZ78095.1 SDR family NAD(P)-dependent oxidoreductase [Bacteroidales bacterium]
MKKRGSLDGTTVLVTGASQGIGRAIALTLAAEGAALMLNARDGEALTELVNHISDRDGNAVHCAADLTTGEGLQELVEFTGLIYPSLDIIVHNAGMGVFKLGDELSADDWERQMALNATAIFRLTQAMEPMLSRSSAPLLIGILSDAATRFFPYGSAYSASKAAAHAFLGSLRKEWQAQGRRVSAIYPGLVATAFDGQDAMQNYKLDWLDPEDVAEAVLYICRQAPHVLVDEIVLHPISQEY